jgi:hypothetical protein
VADKVRSVAQERSQTPTEVVSWAFDATEYAEQVSRENLELSRTIRSLREENAVLSATLKIHKTFGGVSSPKAQFRPIALNLLKKVHPDRWSRGQLATEVCHEITVELTKLLRE